jgi:Mg-chelatase subunit ChlD
MNNPKLQVCFVLDCTASMQPWIDAAKEKIVDTLECIHKQYPKYKISAAFVGYRDFHDDEQIIKIPFTKDIETLQDLIMDIVAEGGDDVCEDVSGAYRFVNNLEWDADVKCVFHITDAPNHGAGYHEDNIEDDYPEGHPYINLNTEVRDLATKEVELTVFSIKRSTDIMYNIMRNIYENVYPNRFNVVRLVGRKYNINDIFLSEISQRIVKSINSHSL